MKLTASGSGSVVDQIMKPCSVIGEHSFDSLANAVYNLTNNGVIEITKSNVQ